MAGILDGAASTRIARKRFARGIGMCGMVALVGVLGLRTAAQPHKQSPAADNAMMTRGQEVYATNCAACHGVKGDGSGPMARFLYPRPRHFGEAKFRIVTTINGKPSDDDLMQVVNHGMPGSAMFPFNHLPEADKKALVAYLRELTRQAFIEFAKQQADAAEEPVELEELRQAAITQLKPGEVLAFPGDFPAFGEESVARGAKLYATGCAACHGVTGKGDGAQAQKNDDGTPTRPRDLTRGIFKGGRDPKQIYARIMLGMPGSPMPASNQTLKPADAGDLTNFLLSLSTREATARVEHRRTTLSARRVEGAIPTVGRDAAWKAAASQRIVISPLWWRDHEDPEFDVAALHDGKTLAIRLTWRDLTKNSAVARPEDFLDMAAVQLCDVRPEPFLGMGAAKGRVELWLWRAGALAHKPSAAGPLDEYPFAGPIYQALIKGAGKPPDFLTARAAGNPNASERTTANLAADGAGSTTFLPPTSQLTASQADWNDGRWSVVVRRPLQVPADGLSLSPAKNCSIAFAVWDGAVRDRNGQKLVSIWHDLKLEE